MWFHYTFKIKCIAFISRKFWKIFICIYVMNFDRFNIFPTVCKNLPNVRFKWTPITAHLAIRRICGRQRTSKSFALFLPCFLWFWREWALLLDRESYTLLNLDRFWTMLNKDRCWAVHHDRVFLNFVQFLG